MIDMATQAVPTFLSKSTCTTNSSEMRDASVGPSLVMVDRSSQLNAAPLSIEMICDNDKEVRYHTGLDSYKLFLIVHKYLVASCTCTDDHAASCHKHPDPAQTFKFISTENQLLLALSKLRLNHTEKTISRHMSVGLGTVSKIFKFWVRLMFRKFKLINTDALLHQLQQNMPDEVRQQYPNLRAIYDCTEIKTQKSSDPIAQRQLWSQYKHAHTIKALTECESSGVLTRISDTYGGSATDKDMFEKSRVLEKLNEGEAIMVDRGFLIQDILQGTGVELLRPAFLKDGGRGGQLNNEDRTTGMAIARHRGVIENINAKIKCFKILSHTIPITLMPIINEIFFVCSFLTTFDPPFRR
jgi:hypothetical protein